LLPVPGQKRSIDYVNANYIDGFQRSRAYIGTQGPLPATFDCFWRMVWEQRVAIIVMITNLVERGRVSKQQYFQSFKWFPPPPLLHVYHVLLVWLPVHFHQCVLFVNLKMFCKVWKRYALITALLKCDRYYIT